jgi:hypothetical protein
MGGKTRRIFVFALPRMDEWTTGDLAVACGRR